MNSENRDKLGRFKKGAIPANKIYPKIVGSCLTCFMDIIARCGTLNKNRKYCSVYCSIKSKVGISKLDTKVTTICLSCFSIIKDYKSRKKKYCSHKCYVKNNSGVNHNNYKEIKSDNPRLRKIEMKRKEYRLWRQAVFERDNWKCIQCGVEDKEKIGKGIIIQADHIKSWKDYPELRYAIDNGRTLCVECHKRTETNGIYRKKILTAET